MKRGNLLNIISVEWKLFVSASKVVCRRTCFLPRLQEIFNFWDYNIVIKQYSLNKVRAILLSVDVLL